MPERTPLQQRMACLALHNPSQVVHAAYGCTWEEQSSACAGFAFVLVDAADAMRMVPVSVCWWRNAASHRSNFGLADCVYEHCPSSKGGTCAHANRRHLMLHGNGLTCLTAQQHSSVTLLCWYTSSKAGLELCLHSSQLWKRFHSQHLLCWLAGLHQCNSDVSAALRVVHTS